jgi:hypothetical protein
MNKKTMVLLTNYYNKTAHTTGLDFNTNFSKYHSRLKLVFSTQHSDQLAGTYALLPILSYDYNNITSNNI